MHIQDQIIGIQSNKSEHNIRKRGKKIKFKLSLDLSLEDFDSMCRSSNSGPWGARSLSNFKTLFSTFKMAANASRILDKDT
jgi:hypothetical protein